MRLVPMLPLPSELCRQIGAFVHIDTVPAQHSRDLGGARCCSRSVYRFEIDSVRSSRRLHLMCHCYAY